MSQCFICKKPEPRECCWQGLFLDCPHGKPPSHLGADDLWKVIIQLRDRIDELSGEA